MSESDVFNGIYEWVKSELKVDPMILHNQIVWNPFYDNENSCFDEDSCFHWKVDQIFDCTAIGFGREEIEFNIFVFEKEGLVLLEPSSTLMFDPNFPNVDKERPFLFELGNPDLFDEIEKGIQTMIPAWRP